MNLRPVVYADRGILFSLQKEGKLAIGSNVDEPGGRYVKLNMPDTEGQMTPLIRAVQNSRTHRSRERRVLVRGWEQGEINRELLFSGCEVSVMQDGCF